MKSIMAIRLEASITSACQIISLPKRHCVSCGWLDTDHPDEDGDHRYGIEWPVCLSAGNIDDGQHTYPILDEGSDSSNENKTWPRHISLRYTTKASLHWCHRVRSHDRQQKGAIQSGLIRTRRSQTNFTCSRSGSLKPWWARYLSEREESAFVEVNRKESNARYQRENQKPQWRLNSDPRFWWREYTTFKLTPWQGWTQREPCTFPGLIWRLFAQPASPTKRQVILNCIQGRDHIPGRLTLASIAARIVTSNTLKASQSILISFLGRRCTRKHQTHRLEYFAEHCHSVSPIFWVKGTESTFIEM